MITNYQTSTDFLIREYTIGHLPDPSERDFQNVQNKVYKIVDEALEDARNETKQGNFHKINARILKLDPSGAILLSQTITKMYQINVVIQKCNFKTQRPHSLVEKLDNPLFIMDEYQLDFFWSKDNPYVFTNHEPQRKKRYFHNPNTVFTKFWDMAMKNELTDMWVLVNDQKFSAHKVILSLRSEYFKKKLVDQIKLSQHDEKIFMITDTVSTEIFKAVLKFLYVGHLDFNIQNDLSKLVSIIELAQKIEQNDLTAYCLDKIEDLLSKEDFTIDKNSLFQLIKIGLFSVDNDDLLIMSLTLLNEYPKRFDHHIPNIFDEKGMKKIHSLASALKLDRILHALTG